MSDETKNPKIAKGAPRIAVIGVGGAGGNAVNNMIAADLEGVEFMVANTDTQALASSEAGSKIQLGATLTDGQGAGSKPEIGAAAAEEAVEELRSHIDGCHMVFVAAGMGGGTGTGAAAVVARVAQELGILTVGVVTKPFHFEGSRRMRSAETGIAELARHVDTLIAIPNQNLFRITNEKTTFAKAFELADQVLHAGISCVTDLIVREGLINLDFADVRTIMFDMGAAMMGTGEASGENRAIEAAELAIANPLLDDVTLKGAHGLLVSISGSDNLTLFEVDAAANRIREEVDPEANIIVGANTDADLQDRIRVSIVASGLRPAAGEIRTSQAGAGAPRPAQMTNPAANAVRQGSLPHSGAPLSGPVLRGPDPQNPGPRPIGNTVTVANKTAVRPPQPQPAAPGPGQPPLSARKAPPPRTAPPGDQRPAAVQIEVGPPRMLTSGTLSCRVPGDRPVHAPETAKAAFMPEAPATVRRTPPRMPDVEDFPPIAQRELQKKGTNNAPLATQRKRSRLFDRLKGNIDADPSSDITDLAEISTPLDDQEAAKPSEAQQVEIPRFFKRKIQR